MTAKSSNCSIAVALLFMLIQKTKFQRRKIKQHPQKSKICLNFFLLSDWFGHKPIKPIFFVKVSHEKYVQHDFLQEMCVSILKGLNHLNICFKLSIWKYISKNLGDVLLFFL